MSSILPEQDLAELHRINLAAYEVAEIAGEKRAIVSSMLEAFQNALDSGQVSSRSVYYHLNTWMNHPTVWDWLVDRIRHADDKELVSISTAILDVVEDDTLDIEWRNKILNLLLERKCWRAVAFAYEGDPERLVADLIKITQP